MYLLFDLIEIWRRVRYFSQLIYVKIEKIYLLYIAYKLKYVSLDLRVVGVETNLLNTLYLRKVYINLHANLFH